MCGWLELEMALASRFLSSIASATPVSLLRGRQDLASRSRTSGRTGMISVSLFLRTH